MRIDPDEIDGLEEIAYQIRLAYHHMRPKDIAAAAREAIEAREHIL